MTFNEREFTFEEEIERLEEEREDLAAKVAEMDEDNPQQNQKAQRGLQIDVYLDGLEWARTAHDDDEFPQWDEDVDGVTLAGLTGGELGAVEGEVSDGAQRGQSAHQIERVAKVRMATVEAPYLDGSMTETQEVAAIAGLPIGFLKWAAAKVEELSSVGNGDRSDFATLLAEKRQSQ